MIEDQTWRAFAITNSLALLGCYFSDRPHDSGFIEAYANAARGSGEALLSALKWFAEHTARPELAEAPLMLWGMSAGGEFNYEFTAWKPERVITFVVNKGGIYYTALVPELARQVPGLLFFGGRDLEFRRKTIEGIFAVNRRAGALWALAEESSAAHVVGRSRDIAIAYFEEILSLRVSRSSSRAPELRMLKESSGFLGNLHSKDLDMAGLAAPADPLTSWLPTQRIARMWKALVTDTPFER